jgi:hypothetical protein
MGKVRFKVVLRREFEPREIVQSRAQSMGRPKIVLTVTSRPKAKENVIWLPD